MKVSDNYINLQINVNFANEKADDILKDIEKVLEFHGYTQFNMKMSHEGSYEIDEVNFFPIESV